MTRPAIRGFIGGRLIVEAKGRCVQAGGIGPRTKVESVTCFDDVTLGLLGSE